MAVICPDCGNETMGSSITCPLCGASLESDKDRENRVKKEKFDSTARKVCIIVMLFASVFALSRFYVWGIAPSSIAICGLTGFIFYKVVRDKMAYVYAYLFLYALVVGIMMFLLRS